MPIPDEILVAHVDAMRRLAQALVRDPTRADDVTQRALLTAIRRPPESHRNLRGWLFAVVRNAARDERRTERRQTERDRAGARPEGAPDGPTIAAQVESQKRLLNAVFALPEVYRDVVWLRYFDGLPPRKIAARLDISVETVRTRHRRAVDRLRTQLDDDHDGRRVLWMAALLPLAGTRAPTAPWIGGLLMATKVKSASLIAAVVLALVGGWVLLRTGDAPVAEPPKEVGAANGTGPRLTGMERKPDAKPTTEGLASDEGVPGLKGHVVDEHGQPLAGCEILVGPSSAVEDRTVLATTDAVGAFFIPWEKVNIADAVRVVARAPERRCEGRRLSRWGPPTGPITFRLPRARTCVFVVRDGDTDRPLVTASALAVLSTNTMRMDTRSRADARGRVIVQLATDQMPGRSHARFEAPGYEPIEQALPQPGAATAARPRDVYLFKSDGFRIRVTDADGTPVQGVQVTVWTGASYGSIDPRTNPLVLSSSFFPDTSRLVDQVRSDANGIARFPPLTNGESWHAHATATKRVGYAYGAFRAGKERVLVLHPADRVTVEVVDERGERVDGAIVRCWPWAWTKALQGGGFHLPPMDLQRTASDVTDAAGRVTLDVQRAGPADKRNISAQRADIGLAWVPIPEPTDKGPAKVQIVLKATRTAIPVLVVDSQHMPIEGALVSYKHSAPGVLTDADGHTTLRSRSVNPDYVHTTPVVAMKQGFAPAQRLVEGDTEPTTLVLHPARTLRGRVIDANGDGTTAYVDVYRGAVAELSAAERKKRARLFQLDSLGRVHADADGYFHHGALPPGPWYVIVAHVDTRVETLIQSADESVELRLPPSKTRSLVTGALHGEVRALDGSYLTRYSVSLSTEKRGYSPVLKGRRFRFEDVPGGAYTLRAQSEDGAQRIEMPVEIRAASEEEVQVILGHSYSLRARILAPDGTAITNASVRTYRSKAKYGGYARTDADGWFDVTHQLAATYRIELAAPDDGPAFALQNALVTVGPNAPPAPTLRAVRAARLVLVLDDERFEDAEKGWTRDHSSKSEASLHTTLRLTRPDGAEGAGIGLFHGRRATEWALLPGRYRLFIKSYHHGRFEADVVVTGAEDVVVTVQLTD